MVRGKVCVDNSIDRVHLHNYHHATYAMVMRVPKFIIECYPLEFRRQSKNHLRDIMYPFISNILVYKPLLLPNICFTLCVPRFLT
jgi:hypothetical protein